MNFLSNKSKRHKILIVEDNAFNRELLFEMLKEDYDVIEARDGAEGIKKLKKYREKLSLVLLDGMIWTLKNGKNLWTRCLKNVRGFRVLEHL